MVARRGLLKSIGAGAVAAAAGDFVRPETGRDGTVHALPLAKARACILLDRSGSMSAVRQATVDGLNAFLDEQRDKHDLSVSLYQFDCPSGNGALEITETFVDRPGHLTPKLSLDDYYPRGGTPLRAAVVDGITRLEKFGNDKILLVIQTDGQDTSSPPEITMEVVKNLIESKQKLGNWTFVFLGADIDAWEAGDSMSISKGNTLQYANTYTGTLGTYTATAASTNVWYASSKNQSLNFFANTATAAPSIDVHLDVEQP